MKKIVVLVAVMVFGISFAQENKKPIAEKKGDLTEVTYFYENGSVEQQGTFNALGKLHGTWTSFDVEGNKVSYGKYDNGRKVGKWFFWADDMLREVDFLDSRIVQVNEWNNKKTKVAIRD